MYVQVVTVKFVLASVLYSEETFEDVLGNTRNNILHTFKRSSLVEM